MFKRILIPLDGSPFAEHALEPGFDIAKAFGAEVVLLRVVTSDEAAGVPAIAPPFFAEHSLVGGSDGSGAWSYLSQTKDRWSSEKVPVVTKILAGAPAAAIVGAAKEAGADMIVMSTHGRSAIGRIIYGSVAEAVLRGAQLPVLLIPIRLPF